MPPPPLPAAPAGGHPPPCTLYLAYGANMAASVLAKRGVHSLSSEAAVVADRGTWLSFSHRGGYASLHLQRQLRRLPWPAADCSAASTAPPLRAGPAWQQPHGVLHTLRPGDLQRLAGREVGYRAVQLAVFTYRGEACRAAAFVSSPLLQLYRPVPPTRRYRSLLVEGSRQHGLDGSYTAWLEGLEVADGPLDSRYDACLADTLAKLLAACALAGIGWASAHV